MKTILRYIAAIEARPGPSARIFILLCVLLAALPCLAPGCNVPAEVFERALAYRWAPILYQIAESKTDFIGTVNYDNDWNCRNNWDNLFGQGFPMRGASYYSVVTSETHWFIVYGFYLACDHDFGHSHENDFEAILLVVRKPSAGDDLYGVLEVMATEHHQDYSNYRSEGSSWYASDGVIDLGYSDGYNRPVIHQEDEGHGIWGGRPDSSLMIGMIRYCPSLADISTISEPVVPEAVVPNELGTVDADYALISIFEPEGLWEHRHSDETFAGWGNFGGDSCNNAHLLCGIDSANAPWAGCWNGFGTDPIHFVACENDNFGIVGDWSLVYERNQYWDGYWEDNYWNGYYNDHAGNAVVVYWDDAYGGPELDFNVGSVMNLGVYHNNFHIDFQWGKEQCWQCTHGSNGGDCSCGSTLGDCDCTWNDHLSSVKVRPGYEVTLYMDANLQGPAFTIRSDCAWVGGRFNDGVSSLTIRATSDARRPVATVYEDINYAGAYAEFWPIGQDQYYVPSVSDPNTIAVGNDRISSVRVKPGWEVVLWEHGLPRPSFDSGRSVVIDCDVHNVGNLDPDFDWNDEASAIQTMKA